MSALARSLLFLLAALPASLCAQTSRAQMTSQLPEYHAEDSSAAVVTTANLLASERFWPYQVELIRPWQPAGRAQALPAASGGVLIRVEASGMARVDFGRDGLYEVPIVETDLVQRADRIRRGELEKLAPNFVLAIGPRLVDSGSSSLRAFPYSSAAERSGFLCIFADPEASGFSELAAALEPLRERDGLLTVLFPQGEHSDESVRERLRALGWTVPFVFDHLAEPYTRTLLSEGAPLPALQLYTPEGRMLFQSGWKADSVSTLTSVLAEVSGGSLASSPLVDRK